METSGSSNSRWVFNSNIFSVVKEWKYKYHAICFILGVVLSSLFWLQIGGDDRKAAEKELKESKQETEQLRKELVDAKTLRESKEDFVKEVGEKKDKVIKDRKKLYEKGNKDINSTNSSTNAERQRFITEWAEKVRDSLNMAE
jgi:uncharacterized membrane-anchored protein YhcB (DUF1043 family)